MAQIPMENGGFAVCDDADEHWLRRFKWSKARSERGYTDYAYTLIGNSLIYMHRLVVGECGKGQVVDHVDYDGMNNRRANLRLCHYMQNSVHSRKVKGGTSRFKGVYRRGNRWIARIRRQGVYVFQERHASEEAAARSYDRRIIEIDGPFAATNASLGLLTASARLKYPSPESAIVRPLDATKRQRQKPAVSRYR